MSLLEIIARTVLALAPSPSTAPAFAPTAPVGAAPTAAPAPGPTPGPAAAAATTPASAAQVVDRVQQFYAGIKQVTASFRQAVTNDTFGSTKTSDGTLWIMKPGKMRWDYLEKKKAGVEVKKSFISNGTYLYVVEHDNKQVMKKNLERDLMPVAISFLYGKGDLKAEFSPEIDRSGKYGERTDIVLKLTPKQPSAQYKNLYLVVSPKDFHVSQSVIIDSSNNVNHFRFFGPDFEKSMKDSYFEFDPRSVKNYNLIDADAQKAGAVPNPPPLPAVPAARDAKDAKDAKKK
jgi:outer membrane lipoprotein-sorting protein